MSSACSVSSRPGAGLPDRGSVRRCRATADVGERTLGDSTPGVSRVLVTLVDRHRSTAANSSPAATPCRILRTEVRAPTRRTHPLPLIVVAHGADGDPSSLAPLLDAWARAGYVVAAPKLPTTEKDEHGAALRRESVEQAHDLSFVITELVRRSEQSLDGALRDTIDRRHIGAAGMSLGGLAVYGLVSNTCCRDPRVRAAVLLAAVRRQFPDDHYEENRAPVMLVQGDADGGYHNSVEAYPELAPPKWFITLHGSTHSPPFEVPPGPEAPLVSATTTSFWDRYLRGSERAEHQITRAVRESHHRATLRRDLGAR